MDADDKGRQINFLCLLAAEVTSRADCEAAGFDLLHGIYWQPSATFGSGSFEIRQNGWDSRFGDSDCQGPAQCDAVFLRPTTGRHYWRRARHSMRTGTTAAEFCFPMPLLATVVAAKLRMCRWIVLNMIEYDRQRIGLAADDANTLQTLKAAYRAISFASCHGL